MNAQKLQQVWLKKMRRLIAMLALLVSQAVLAQDYAECLFFYGKGEDARAIVGCRNAAQNGNADAQYKLGLLYREGKGVLQDFAEAVRWFRLAAKQGYAPAQTFLGIMYFLGQGISQDAIRAHMWTNIASVNGDSESVKARSLVASAMTPQQIAEAQRMATECLSSNYRKCD